MHLRLIEQSTQKTRKKRKKSERGKNVQKIAIRSKSAAKIWFGHYFASTGARVVLGFSIFCAFSSFFPLLGFSIFGWFFVQSIVPERKNLAERPCGANFCAERAPRAPRAAHSYVFLVVLDCIQKMFFRCFSILLSVLGGVSFRQPPTDGSQAR